MGQQDLASDMISSNAVPSVLVKWLLTHGVAIDLECAVAIAAVDEVTCLFTDAMNSIFLKALVRSARKATKNHHAEVQAVFTLPFWIPQHS